MAIFPAARTRPVVHNGTAFRRGCGYAAEMSIRHLTGTVPWASVAAVVLLIAAPVMLLGGGAPNAPAVATAAPQSIDQYADLRRVVEAGLPAPRVTADVDEFRGRGDALGVAMQEATPHAGQGRALT